MGDEAEAQSKIGGAQETEKIHTKEQDTEKYSVMKDTTMDRTGNSDSEQIISDVNVEEWIGNLTITTVAVNS